MGERLLGHSDASGLGATSIIDGRCFKAMVRARRNRGTVRRLHRENVRGKRSFIVKAGAVSSYQEIMRSTSRKVLKAEGSPSFTYILETAYKNILGDRYMFEFPVKRGSRD